MAAIVATLCYWPIGIAIALLLALFGVPALVYAAPVFPWQQTRGFPSQRQK